MLSKFFAWLKEFFSFHPEETVILNFLDTNANQRPKSHPKYWQPAFIAGKPWYPPLKGIVDAKTLYGDKSIAELEALLEQSTEPTERKQIRKILQVKLSERNKQRSKSHEKPSNRLGHRGL
ncbi:MAG: hypothetical protein NTX82_04570 [Candidatus Parcubacteria bacterium]|nr:hypothetical protein [Candidatus Parcubacteria bacterium]